MRCCEVTSRNSSVDTVPLVSCAGGCSCVWSVCLRFLTALFVPPSLPRWPCLAEFAAVLAAAAAARARSAVAAAAAATSAPTFLPLLPFLLLLLLLSLLLLLPLPLSAVLYIATFSTRYFRTAWRQSTPSRDSATRTSERLYTTPTALDPVYSCPRCRSTFSCASRLRGWSR